MAVSEMNMRSFLFAIIFVIFSPPKSIYNGYTYNISIHIVYTYVNIIIFLNSTNFTPKYAAFAFITLVCAFSIP